MKTDGIFRLHRAEVSLKANQVLRLIPFGDVHHDSPAHSRDKWKEFLEAAKSYGPEAAYLGMGDYLDSYSCSERIILNNPGLHESTKKRMKKEAEGRIASLAKDLEFLKGRFIGLLSGNHYIEFPDGITSDMLLAKQLGTVHLGVCAAIRVTLCCHGNTRIGLDIFAHHGRGTGSTIGGSMNTVAKMANIAECDIFLMGDNHQRGAIPMGERLRLESRGEHLHLTSRHGWVGRTGSFLRAYVDGEASYVVDRALPPASLGWIEFHIRTTRLVRFDGGRGDRLGLEIKCVQ